MLEDLYRAVENLCSYNYASLVMQSLRHLQVFVNSVLLNKLYLFLSHMQSLMYSQI